MTEKGSIVKATDQCRCVLSSGGDIFNLAIWIERICCSILREFKNSIPIQELELGSVQRCSVFIYFLKIEFVCIGVRRVYAN